MKQLTPLGRVLIAVCLGKAHSLARATPSVHVDEMKLLRAIAQVESGSTNLVAPFKKVGKKGERSAFQMKSATWGQYTKEQFKTASTDASLAHLVARMHLTRLKLELERERITPSVWTLAVAWNGGLDYAIKGKVSTKVADYAGRVFSLYHDE